MSDTMALTTFLHYLDEQWRLAMLEDTDNFGLVAYSYSYVSEMTHVYLFVRTHLDLYFVDSADAAVADHSHQSLGCWGHHFDIDQNPDSFDIDQLNADSDAAPCY